MNEFEKVALLATLSSENESCVLNHGKKELHDHIAIDFIVLPMGYKQDNGIMVQTDELIIPVCLECLDGMNDPDWLLIYCIVCHASQWIYKPLAKFNYGNDKFKLLDECPICQDNGQSWLGTLKID